MYPLMHTAHPHLVAMLDRLVLCFWAMESSTCSRDWNHSQPPAWPMTWAYLRLLNVSRTTLHACAQPTSKFWITMERTSSVSFLAEGPHGAFAQGRPFPFSH